MERAEQLNKSKIPCPETHIEVKRSLCDICTGPYCGLSAYVRDGEVIKVEGLDGYPHSEGKLCTKGASNRSQMYRADRIRTPLRRTGARGSGSFEPISWEEAYQEIGARLNAVKAAYDPHAVVFFSGYAKWYRFWLQRLAHSFGSVNYASENSSCSKSTQMAWRVIAGNRFSADLKNSKLYIGWGCNTLISSYQAGRKLIEAKKRGVKIIIIDPRVTVTSERLADIHLRIRPGTDGILALGMANLIIERGWYDRDYVAKHIHGFEQYAAYAKQFSLARTAELTGVDAALIEQATELYAKTAPASAYFPSAAVTHRTNGFNSMRAMISLQAILGNIDRAGGELPMYEGYLYTDTGYDTMQYQFLDDVRPKDGPPLVGTERFPLWGAMTDECQAMDLTRHINEQTPYPLKALVSFGMNVRMFPETDRLVEAIRKLDFVVGVDIFMTTLCENADIVLPACTSLERSELRGYGGGWLTCTEPAVPPLYESRPDTRIICELAGYLAPEDELLCSGEERTMRYMISNLSVTLEELRAAPLPVQVKERRIYKAGTYLGEGFPTPTGKLELHSEIIKPLQRQNPRLDPLPIVYDCYDTQEAARYPLTLIIGARIPNAVHSRLHGAPVPRSLRPEPLADMHPADAAARDIRDGDPIEIRTKTDCIRVRARLTEAGQRGDVFIFHGYIEANGNALVANDHLDPYSGFPGYRQLRCEIGKAEQ